MGSNLGRLKFNFLFKQRIFQVRGAGPVNCMFGKFCMIVMILYHDFSCSLLVN